MSRLSKPCISKLCLAAVYMGALLLGPVAAQPAPSSATPPEPVSQVGEATTQLLALQRSGAAASSQPRPIPGEVAGRSYQRYLKSFDYPIPERFGTTVGGTSAAGSSGSGR